MAQSPVRSLVASCLRPMADQSSLLDSEFELALFDAAGRIGAEAVAGSGSGLDHFRGERVLAAMRLRETPRGHEHRLSCAITDRKTVLSGWSSTKGGFNPSRFAVAHAELVRIESKDSMLSSHVTLFTAQGKHPLTFVKATGMLAQFYRAMLAQIPPDARVEPPTAWTRTTREDPSGARSAAAELYVDDPSIRSILETLDEAVRSGRAPASDAHEMVRRVVLAHRSAVGGPGAGPRGWISPMSELPAE